MVRILALGVCLASSPLLATEPTDVTGVGTGPNNAVHFNLGNLLPPSVITLEFERVLTRRFSLGLSASYMPTVKNMATPSPTRVIDQVNGWGGGLTGRFYPFQTAPGGLHFALSLDFLAMNFDYTESVVGEPVRHGKAAVVGYQAGGTVGYTFLPWQRLALSVGAGLRLAEGSGRREDKALFVQTVAPLLRFSIGAAF